MMNLPSSPNNTKKICPFLGLADDTRTAMVFPSAQNYCYHVTHPTAPSDNHQSEFCLNGAYSRCPVYMDSKTGPMPMEMTSDGSRKNRKKKLPRIYILTALILVVGIAGVWLLSNNGLASNSVSETKTAPVVFTQPSTELFATLTATNTPQPTKTMTPLPPTTTATLPPLHMIETPIGLERQFVVHRVLEGEGFISIAATYNTNEDAIRAVNYALGDSLWADTVLVIPLGQTDISGIPPMSVFLVSDEGMTIEALALEQNVDAALLRELNALPEGYILHQGEWVLIPHEMTIP